MVNKTVLTVHEHYTKENIEEDIVTLINSCTEGISGEWVPAGDTDGFEAMRDGLYDLARKLGLTLPEDKLKDEDDFNAEEDEDED